MSMLRLVGLWMSPPNIAGHMAMTMDEAWEVAKMVGLDADIRELPMGMHTIVGEGGSTFSGGQRQRLLFRRLADGQLSGDMSFERM